MLVFHPSSYPSSILTLSMPISHSEMGIFDTNAAFLQTGASRSRIAKYFSLLQSVIHRRHRPVYAFSGCDPFVLASTEAAVCFSWAKFVK